MTFEEWKFLFQSIGTSALVLAGTIYWDRYKRKTQYKNICILLAYELHKIYGIVTLAPNGCPPPEIYKFNVSVWEKLKLDYSQHMDRKLFQNLLETYSFIEKLQGARYTGNEKNIDEIVSAIEEVYNDLSKITSSKCIPALSEATEKALDAND